MFVVLRGNPEVRLGFREVHHFERSVDVFVCPTT